MSDFFQTGVVATIHRLTGRSVERLESDLQSFARTITLHDCDIQNYDREMLARLVYPIAHPNLGFEFSKGYYSRVSDRLHGRVTRLFFTPVVRAIQNITPEMPYLRFLDSFRYALAGEFAMKGGPGPSEPDSERLGVRGQGVGRSVP